MKLSNGSSPGISPTDCVWSEGYKTTLKRVVFLSRPFEIKPGLLKKLIKLSKKNKIAYEAVMKKIDEVVGSYDIGHYKNLRHDIKDCKRVHLGHFVLVFVINHENKTVSFEDYDHHDNIYK